MTHFGEGRGVIRLGDTTTHGGEVISASGFPDMGKRIACVGDMVKCPKCKGTFPIVEGDNNKTYMNKPMAYHGHKTACGAALISSWGEVSVPGSQRPENNSKARRWGNETEELEIIYEIVDAITEKPVEGMTYKITSGGRILLDGQKLEGGKSKSYSVHEHSNLSFIAWINGTINGQR